MPLVRLTGVNAQPFWIDPATVAYVRASSLPGCSAVGHGNGAIGAVLGTPEDVVNALGLDQQTPALAEDSAHLANANRP